MLAADRHAAGFAQIGQQGCPDAGSASAVIGQFAGCHFARRRADKGATAVIPNNPSRAFNHPLDKHLYAQRHLVECCFSKLKQFRRAATRFEKTARNSAPSSHSPLSHYGCDNCLHRLGSGLVAATR